MNSTDTKPRSKAEREAEEKAKRRAEAATIVAGLKQALDADEQLLGFARGRLAGGIRGKMSLGPEAFFAPFVNLGLTERRLVIQHINAETGRPGEILPHYYALGDIAALSVTDIETFGGEAAARLVMRLRNDQHTRLRLRGQSNFESAQAIVEVFRSLTSAKRPRTTPTQRVCATCQHILDQPFKFCPYCGQQQDIAATTDMPVPDAMAEPERAYPPTPPGATEPDFLDAVPYQDADVFRGPTVEDGLDFLTRETISQPTAVPEAAPIAVPEPESSPAPVTEPETSVAVSSESEPVAEMSAEEAVLETPSAFEGWSVDPGAGSAIVEPSVEAVPTTTEHAKPPAAHSGFDVDTEASVAEAVPPASDVMAAETVGNVFHQTDVHMGSEGMGPIVHPKADFAPLPLPDPVAVTADRPPHMASFDAPPTESGPAPEPESAPHSEPVVLSSTSEVVRSFATDEAAQEGGAMPVTEMSAPVPAAFEPPPSAEVFSEPVAPVSEQEHGTSAVSAAPVHESAGFVTEPVATETSTPVSQEFEAFAPVISMPAAPEFASAPEATELPAATPLAEAMPTAAVEAVTPAAVLEPAPVSVPSSLEPPSVHASAVPDAPPAPPVSSPSENRFAALLREVRGEETPVTAAAVPPAAAERRDGPMRVQVHIDRPPIVVNEAFDGRNADEVVGKLKARVLSELNFAMRLMVNSFSNLRFAQETVRRYNDREKTHYPVPNSCWEFLQSAEEIKLVTIHLNS
jgi:hypothetical protein